MRSLNRSVLAGAVVVSTLAWGGAPCSGPEYRQFDFWLGQWDVATPDGKVAGTNSITAELNGCVLHEHWVGAKGLRGESFNVFNAVTKRWHQTWVDDAGNSLLLDGAFADGRMVLTGAAAGGKTLNKITWEARPDGRVRQHWETSTDAGKTWVTAFDGLYAKRSTASSGDGSRVRNVVKPMPW